MTKKLEPCPFCSGDAEMIENGVQVIGTSPWYFVKCNSCHCSTMVGPKKAVIKTWNARPLKESGPINWVKLHKDWAGWHVDGCPARSDWLDKCDCGLDEKILSAHFSLVKGMEVSVRKLEEIMHDVKPKEGEQFHDLLNWVALNEVIYVFAHAIHAKLSAQHGRGNNG